MQYAGMDAGIASWWGQGTRTDARIPLLLQGARGSTFRWALYYEKEGYSDPTAAQIAGDLHYIAARYGANPSYLRVKGKPVIFVYGDAADACGVADRWAKANAGRFYVVLKVFPGYKTCAHQPSSWHQYAPAVASDSQAGYSYSISPGFYKKGEAAPRLKRDPARWAANVRAMIASKAPLAAGHDVQRMGRGHRGRVSEGMGEPVEIRSVPRHPSPVSRSGPSTSASVSRTLRSRLVISRERRRCSRRWSCSLSRTAAGAMWGEHSSNRCRTSTRSRRSARPTRTTPNRTRRRTPRRNTSVPRPEARPTPCADDCSPSPTCQSTQDNIFRQVRVAGKVPRSYVEGATASC